jgi:cell wall-associated NlpC family hydrolase
MIEVNDLIGLPYSESGNGPESYDCYGLIRECFRRMGHSIPKYLRAGTRKEHAAIICQAMDESWEEVAEAVAGVVVLFKVEGFNSHLGFVLDNGRFIHVIAGQNVVVQSLSHPSWEKRIVGFYRYTGM